MSSFLLRCTTSVFLKVFIFYEYEKKVKKINSSLVTYPTFLECENLRLFTMSVDVDVFSTITL